MSWSIRGTLAPYKAFLAAGVVTAICILLVIAARGLGALEPLELLLYDATLRMRSAQPVDERVVLIVETEQDLQRFGHPLPDNVLARAIDVLAAAPAKAIGIDKYRDVTVPPGTDELTSVLARNKQVVWAMKAATPKQQGVLAPSPLRGTLRAGFNDLVTDTGGVVRRGLIYLEDQNGNTLYSFPLLLAASYLGHSNPMLEPAPEREDWVRVGKTTVPALEPHEGGYANVDTAGYQYLLDYRGMPARFRRFTLGELLDQRVDSKALEGKMVLLGSSAESLGDFFDTPFARDMEGDTTITGVELHAHSASQMLRFAFGESSPTRVLSKFWELLLIVVWGSAGALLAWRTPAFSRLALFVASGALACLAVALASISFGWWLPTAATGLSFLLCAGAAAGQRAMAEYRLRQGLMRIFSTHVSKMIADELWRERDALLEGRRLRSRQITATVLFTDIRGFTSISERLAVADLFMWLNEYMDAMAAAVDRHVGIVKQFSGDGIMALFGAPVEHSTREEIAQDATRAVQCALEMGVELDRLNAGWAARGLPAVGIRAGINTGPVVSGSLGGAERLEYTLIGDTVNTASRLESFAGNDLMVATSCRVLVSEPTRELIGDAFDVKYVGEVQLKGKAAMVRVFQVLGPAAHGMEAGRHN